MMMTRQLLRNWGENARSRGAAASPRFDRELTAEWRVAFRSLERLRRQRGR